MRIKWLLPIFLGALLGTALPVESSHLPLYRAFILPPTGSTGQTPRLNCGWHDGSCGTSSTGNYLDWNETSTYTVYFRGIFSRSNSSTESTRLYVKTMLINKGDRICDEQRAYLIDRGDLKIRGTMRYLHISTSNHGGEFNLSTSSLGVYNSRAIGSILLDDTGCGSWNGTHVHGGYRTTGEATRYKNTNVYPSGDYCVSGSSCYKTYTNNKDTYWTHKFLWSGP